MIVRVAEAGELLGLAACVSGTSFEASAVAVTDCQVNLLKSNDLLHLLETDHPIALNTIYRLSDVYLRSHALACSLGLSTSAGDKLSKLFLEWCGAAANGHDPVRLMMDYTHEELAEMIGSSRETVTRVMRLFRDRGLIAVDGDHILIPDPRNLRGVIGSAEMRLRSQKSENGEIHSANGPLL